MYHVPPTSRPRLGLLLIDCLWYGARRGAFYGLCGGAAYGAFWLIIGAVIGGPIGFVLGSVVGALHGLICGAIIHRWSGIFAKEFSADRISWCEWMLRLGMAGLFFAACELSSGLLGGFTGDTLAGMLIPAGIVALCAFLASGEMLELYLKRWVFQSQTNQSRPQAALSDGIPTSTTGL